MNVFRLHLGQIGSWWVVLQMACVSHDAAVAPEGQLSYPTNANSRPVAIIAGFEPPMTGCREKRSLYGYGVRRDSFRSEPNAQ